MKRETKIGTNGRPVTISKPENREDQFAVDRLTKIPRKLKPRRQRSTP